MKGKYHIVIQNNRIKYEFEIKRNITVIRGDSATGKTTLMNLVETYERLGDESGISISCSKKCKTLNNSNWESVISQSNECIIFIDEDTKVITTKEFASMVRDSDNYYIIITRENLPNLPYSVQEVYGIHTNGKYADIRQTYNSFYRLYDMNKKSGNSITDVVITEDANSGFEFYKAIVNKDVSCISAGGKSKIRGLIQNYKDCDVLIIADGAAFGSEMNELYLYMMSNPNVSLYLPESFEWIILSSRLIDGNRVKDIIDRPEEYVESREYFSWEQFFTNLLISETRDTYLSYNKSHLNEVYLHSREKQSLIKVVSVIKDRLGCEQNQ